MMMVLIYSNNERQYLAHFFEEAKGYSHVIEVIHEYCALHDSRPCLFYLLMSLLRDIYICLCFTLASCIYYALQYSNIKPT